MKFHHIGIACADILSTKKYLYELFNVIEESEEIFDELQNASLCMITLNDGTKVELVSGEVVEKLVKRKHFLYHICYATCNIEKKIEDFIYLDAKVVSELKSAKLFGGNRVVFLMTKLGMIELLETEEGSIC